jgi:hypothetical protein
VVRYIRHIEVVQHIEYIGYIGYIRYIEYFLKNKTRLACRRHSGRVAQSVKPRRVDR